MNYAPIPIIKSDSLAIAVNRKLGFQHVSPFMYQGGKCRHVRHLSKLMPAKIDYLFEPFMGGLSTTIFLIKSERVRAENCVAGDVHRPLVNFFRVLQTDYESLTLQLANDSLFHSGGSIHLFQQAVDILHESDNELELARAYFIFIRTSLPCCWEIKYSSFAPSTLIGGTRIGLAGIFRLPHFGALVAPVEFRESDYTESLQSAAKLGKAAFVFLDPPYEQHQEIYGVEFDLDKFAENCHAVAGECRFMITLNDSPANRARFSGYNIIERKQSYNGSHKRDRAELVICNYELDFQDYYLNQLGYRLAT